MIKGSWGCDFKNAFYTYFGVSLKENIWVTIHFRQMCSIESLQSDRRSTENALVSLIKHPGDTILLI